MKKYNLLKVIAITIVVAWILTLIIPGSAADYSGNIQTTKIAGVGIVGLLSNLSISISYFNGIAVFVIAVAIFYSVLGKLDIYNNFVNKVVTMFKSKERNLVIISAIVFAILAMFVSDSLILIAFIPFVYKVMKELGIDKKVILSSTIIACIIGSMCGIYNSTLFTTFNLTINTLLLVKIILFAISIAILLFFIVPKKSQKEVKKNTKKSASKSTSKIEVKEKSKGKTKVKMVNKTVYAILSLLLGTFGIQKFYTGKIKEGILCIVFCWTFIPTILSIAEFITILTEKSDKNGMIPASSTRRSNVAFGTGVVLFTLFVILSVIPWGSLFTNFTAFSDFNSWLAGLKIGKYEIFKNIIGSPVIADATTGSSTGVIAAFGSWSMTDMAIFLILVSGVIALVNKIKFNDLISGVTTGIKKVLPVAITAMLISLVLVLMVTTGVNITIANSILTITKGFNIVTSTIATMIGSVLTSDLYYFVSTIGTVFKVTVTNADYYGVVAFIIQSVFNLMMIIAPTSVGLIIGLYYLDIPYNKWFKYIWKALLSILIVIIIISIIIFVLV